MYKRIFLLILIVCAGCKKIHQSVPCATQVCTAIYATIGIHYTDKQGNPIAVTNYSVFDVTTGKALSPGVINYLLILGYYIVATDYNLSLLSTDGDTIRVSATNPATGEVKNTVFVIAGGCNCHVTKISGPDAVQFD
jgi:hypothetical protein